MEKLREEYVKANVKRYELANEPEFQIWCNGYRTGQLSTPKHETVEQWEERTGEQYHRYAPVWVIEKGATCELTYVLMTYHDCVILGFNDPIVANHHGKPNSIGRDDDNGEDTN